MPNLTYKDENIDLSIDATPDEINQALATETTQEEEANTIEQIDTPQKEAEMMAAYSETGELPPEVEPIEIGEPSERVAGLSALPAKGAKALTKWLKGKAGKYKKYIEQHYFLVSSKYLIFILNNSLSFSNNDLLIFYIFLPQVQLYVLNFLLLSMILF